MVSAGVNFHDVLVAMGRLDEKAVGKEGMLMGGEFAGRVARVGAGVERSWLWGHAVAGFGAETWSGWVVTRAGLVSKVPDWSGWD